MIYHLLDWLNKTYSPPGLDMIKFLTFRSGIAAIMALLLVFFAAPKIIEILKKKQIGENIKDDGPKSHKKKAGTPTMGGLIILLCVFIPVLSWGDLTNTYVLLLLAGTLLLGLVGFYDDYLKVVKKLPKGLIARYKLVGQVTVGLGVGAVLYFSPEFAAFNSVTTLPFFKDMNFDYSFLYIPAVIFIITATSNAVNLTDGLDGLAIGLTVIAMMAMALISYITGNAIYADYLNIIFLPGSGEMTIVAAAIIGAGLGFLWYNFFPAQVFMGDTGSLALGGALGIMAVMVKKEFLLPLLAGVFFLETVSVIIQTTYFKFTKKRDGVGKRVFKMAPIHHHFELSGWDEPKIVVRFYIIGIILAIISLTSFKVR